jgi:hypothetical protein
MEVGYIYTHEDSIMTLTKHCFKKEGGRRGVWRYHREGELIQSMLYTCMKLL